MPFFIKKVKHTVQPQYPCEINKKNPDTDGLTLFINGAVPNYNCATGKLLNVSAGGTGYYNKITPYGIALNTPNGGWIEYDINEDWSSGGNTVLIIGIINSIDNPWGGLWVKKSTPVDNQMAVGRNGDSNKLYVLKNGGSGALDTSSISSYLGKYKALSFANLESDYNLYFYEDGNYSGYVFLSGSPQTGTGKLVLGYSSDVDWIAFLRFNRFVAGAQLRRIVENPWGLLAPISKFMLIPPSTFGGVHNLTGTNVVQNNLSGSNSIVQTHDLVAGTTTQTNLSSTGVIVSSSVNNWDTNSFIWSTDTGLWSDVIAGSFFGSNVLQVNLSSIDGIVQTHTLTGQNAVQSNFSTSDLFTKDHIVTGTNVTQSNLCNTGSFSQEHQLTSDPNDQVNLSSSAALINPFTGLNVTQVNLASAGAYSATPPVILTGIGATQANVSSSDTITQVHALTGANSSQGNAATSGAYQQIQQLIATGTIQINSSSSGAIVGVLPYLGENVNQYNYTSSGAIIGSDGWVIINDPVTNWIQI